MGEVREASDVLFWADECTFTRTVRLMQALGCNVERIQDMGMAGAPDAVVYQRAQEEGAVVVTTDQGFGDVRTYPPSVHHGMIVLKMAPEPKHVQAVHHMLRHLLSAEMTFEGTLFIVDAHKYRKRKTP